MSTLSILGIVFGSLVAYMTGVIICFRLIERLWGKSKPDDVGYEVAALTWPVTLWGVIALGIATKVVRPVAEDDIPQAKLHKGR